MLRHGLGAMIGRSATQEGWRSRLDARKDRASNLDWTCGWNYFRGLPSLHTYYFREKTCAACLHFEHSRKDELWGFEPKHHGKCAASCCFVLEMQWSQAVEQTREGKVLDTLVFLIKFGLKSSSFSIGNCMRLYEALNSRTCVQGPTLRESVPRCVKWKQTYCRN